MEDNYAENEVLGSLFRPDEDLPPAETLPDEAGAEPVEEAPRSQVPAVSPATPAPPVQATPVQAAPDSPSSGTLSSTEAPSAGLTPTDLPAAPVSTQDSLVAQEGPQISAAPEAAVEIAIPETNGRSIVQPVPVATDRMPSLEDLKALSEARPAFPLGRIIAVVNQKGGVGKTTTTISLGAAMAEEGAKVLLVDFDPQGALSVGLGLNPNALESTIYNLLLDRSTSLQDVLAKSSAEGLDLLPANIDLSAAEIMLVSEVAREQLLKRSLGPAQETYNYILIDCPPSLGLLTVNALTAADSVIIPLECEYFALRGMALLMDTIEKVQERLNPDLKVEGIVATILDARTLHAREVLSRVTEAFGDKLFKTIIHKTIRFAEAPVVGESILTYAPASTGAQEYRDLAREVMTR